MCILRNEPRFEAVQKCIAQFPCFGINASDHVGIGLVPSVAPRAPILMPDLPSAGYAADDGHVRHPVGQKMAAMYGEAPRCQTKALPIDQLSVYSTDFTFVKPVGLDWSTREHLENVLFCL